MRVVVALGGNALGNTPEEQLARAEQASDALAALVAHGHSLLIVHGNGPQVGSIRLAFEAGHALDAALPDMPLAECTAMSQGYIGFHIAAALSERLEKRGLAAPVASIVTRVEVDPEDPAFSRPEKPIGMFYTREEAEKCMAEEPGIVYREDAGRGWRRVVASPKPIAILERESIRALVDRGAVVVACGGGGVPVVRGAGGGYRAVSAVIDKDFAAAALARAVGAERLVILTAVPRVALDWGKPTERSVSEMGIEEAERYCAEGQFAPGSMLPKVLAAIEFAKAGGVSIIASLFEADAALAGLAGTRIAGGGALGGLGAAAFSGGC